jgi:hypothetical protein
MIYLELSCLGWSADYGFLLNNSLYSLIVTCCEKQMHRKISYYFYFLKAVSLQV